jgi:hypothetical protein
MFIASPLNGDGRIDLQVKGDLEPYFRGTTPFIDHLGAVPDFLEYFWDSAFNPSHVGQDILHQTTFQKENEELLATQKPIWCF